MEDDDEDFEGAEIVDDEPEGEDPPEEESVDDEDPATPADGREEEEEPSKPDKGEETWTKKAAIAERKKRQKAEEALAEVQRELAYIKGQLTQRASPPPAEEPEEEDEPIDLTDLDKSVNKRAEKLARRLMTQRERERAEQDQKEWEALCAESQRDAREEYDDYDEIEARFARRAQTDLALQRRLRKQGDPADWLYQQQVRFEKRQNKGQDKVTELEAELAKLKAQVAGKKPAGPRSLASARGAGPRPRVNAGPQDQGEVFSAVFKKKGA